MHKIYNWPFLTTKNAKLIMLQFKINLNIIYTNIYNDLCHLCERLEHTIKHMMLLKSVPMYPYSGMNFVLPDGRKSPTKTFIC